VDANRFDRFSRAVGEHTDRREMLRTAAAGSLALVGLGTVTRAALGQDITTESSGYEGDQCTDNGDCKKGLTCDTDREKCEYKSSCGGKKGQACQNTSDCCNNKNLKCKSKKCKRKNR
jgi:hypothetical protein